MDASLNNSTSNTEKKKVPKRKFVIEDVIVKDNDKLEPCLVQFSNGVVKEPSKIKGELFRNVSEKFVRRRSERILKVSGGRLNYVGKNFGENIDAILKHRNFLGVLDKKTNKMKLIEVSTFMLHPEQPTTTNNSLNSFLLSNLSQSEKRNALNETFGGRRERAAVRKREASKYNISDMEEALSKTTQNIDTEDLEEEFQNGFSYEDILPPCNRDANLVQNVYKLEDIIPDTELVLYNDEALEYMDGNRDVDVLSPLVRQTIANAKLSIEEEETAKLICIALYIQNHIELLRNRSREAVKLKSCPKLIEKKILSTFSEGRKKVRSRILMDKLITYIIVLSLIANQFSLQWTTLCQSLAIKKERLVKILNIVGVKMQQKDQGYVSLKIPLAKPVYERPLNVKNRKKRQLQ